MLDFTSALYLGLWHPSGSLRRWDRLTTGVPAAMADPPGAGAVAGELAALQGCERGTLAPSTLHLFWDLFGRLAGGGIGLFADAGLYPVGRWGVERAAGRGVPVGRVPHYDPGALLRQLKREAGSRRRPVVVADGFCTACGRPAPVAAYLEMVRARGGMLILDDTQALGILGHSPGPDAPFGRGGGGSLRHSGVGGPDVLLISSLAKGFGVPMAVLSGGRALVEGFDARSETRVHASPPAIAVLRAAEHALEVNRRRGDELRRRLAALVDHFRRRLSDAGLRSAGGLFPMQAIGPIPGLRASALYTRLLRTGIRTVLQRDRDGGGERVSFVINARHRRRDIDRAVGVLSRIAAPGARSSVALEEEP